MKIAVVTAVDKYMLPDANLRGCVNDACAMASCLSSLYGFDNVEYLCNEQATMATVESALHSAAAEINASEGPGVLVWYHSGHGTQIPDLDGDECNSLDEALVMYDSTPYHYMLEDDKMVSIFADVREGVNVTLIFDTCFSGGMNRSLPGEAQDRIRRIPLHDAIIRKVKRPWWCPSWVFPWWKRKTMQDGIQALAKTNILMMSASKENQPSAELRINGQFRGAFTYCLELTMRADQGARLEQSDGFTAKEVLAGVKERLKGLATGQVPCLEGSRVMKKRSFLGV